MKNLFVASALLVLTASCVNQQPNAKQETGLFSQIPPGVPVLLYSEQIKTTDTSSRSWPTAAIYMKIGPKPPIKMAEVGKVGEMPNQYLLSPDKKFLLINLESKIKMLNLDTKELTDLFTAKKQALVMALSPDQKKLFIYDQKYADVKDNEYYVHILEINSKSVNTINHGSAKDIGVYIMGTWRSDNKVVLALGWGEGSNISYYDLDTNALTNTTNEYGRPISRSGYTMAVTDKSIPDMCNDFSGDASSLYKLLEPLSQRAKGEVGQLGMRANVLAISADDNKVLYALAKTIKDKSKCENRVMWSYYVKDLSSGSVRALNDPPAASKEFDDISGLLETEYLKNTAAMLSKIRLGSQDLIIFPEGKRVHKISVFYR